jgi:hypothetical protein
VSDSPAAERAGARTEAKPAGGSTEAVVDLAAYERLAELAEAELLACETERAEDLAPLYAEADRIRAALPGPAPAEAEPALRRATAAQALIGELLGSRLAERGGALEQVHRAREAARAYATTANARAMAPSIARAGT